MEMLTNDKHSSLMRKSVIYGQKSFITSGPGAGPMSGSVSVSTGWKVKKSFIFVVHAK
jgi:hypothetical protein